MIGIQQPTHCPVRILLVMDDSVHALAGTLLLSDLPLPSCSEVVAVAVVASPQTPNRAALSAALDAAQTILWEQGVEVRTELSFGQSAEELTKFANEQCPDLLVIGAQGLRATLGILLSGVAQQMVERATWPVLVARAPWSGLRRVLVASDGSPQSDCAVNYLTQFPLPAGVEVRVIHVLPSLPPLDFVARDRPLGLAITSPLFSPYEVEQMTRQAKAKEREGQAILTQAVEVLKSSGVEATTVLVRGDAATEIIEHARVHNIDLVVAGSRGLGPVAGWLLGSVSRKLVHSAGCSVLIVKELAAEPVTGQGRQPDVEQMRNQRQSAGDVQPAPA